MTTFFGGREVPGGSVKGQEGGDEGGEGDMSKRHEASVG